MLDLDRKDTICAPATADAPAALAIVRVSGPRAFEVRDAVFRPRRARPIRLFTATLGEVMAGDLVVDEALCTCFPEGRSYTGEQSFELSLHGGPARVRATVGALQAAGARLASPGEFTLRAVLTGRMDLTEAESVSDLISARSGRAASAALKNLGGELARRIAAPRRAVIDALAELEARLDFPDEELGDTATRRLSKALDDASDQLASLLQTARLGERLIAGARCLLWGAPNAGKSTLMNALVGESRAIVHETPGTTRDVLEAECVIHGVPLTLVDVAGIREHDASAVEAIGIARAQDERERADLILHLVDGAKPIEAESPPGAILVVTKADLGGTHRPKGALVISAATGTGLEALRAQIATKLGAPPGTDDALLTRARQRDEVAAAKDALTLARAALDAGHVYEVVASELRQAGRALDRLLGKELNEEVLDAIFSRFCIGK